MTRFLLNFAKFCFVLIAMLNLPQCKNNIYPDCNVIKKMLINDQIYRSDPRANPVQFIIDSLSNHSPKLFEKNYNLGVKIYMERNDTTYTKGFINKAISDSLINLQISIDRHQVKLITSWLSNIDRNRIDTLSCFNEMLLILAHTPEDLIENIIPLIKSKKGYISNEQYEYLNKVLNKNWIF